MTAPHAPARPFALVVNPASALGRGARVAARVSRALGAAGVTCITISAPSVAECQREVEREAAQGLRGLILVGGDGFVSTVLQVAAARELPVALVPAGSGNDFARQFNLPRHPGRAVQSLLRAAPRSVDLGVVRYRGPSGDPREKWFAGGLSLGFDAAINRRANALRLPIGPLRYVAALFAEIAALQMHTFHVRFARPTAPRRVPEHRYTGLLATVMNIRTLGGGIPISPDSRVDDGLLELVEVSRVSRPRLLSVLGLLARGRHTWLPEVTVTSVASVSIDAGTEVAFADGDEVGTGPFEVCVAPGALTLLG